MEFVDNKAAVEAEIIAKTDTMMGLFAASVEIQIKTSGNTPKDKGGLRTDTRHVKNAVGQYEVQMNKQYAAAQEAGVIHGSPVVNYTTPGTGPHFMQKAVDKAKERVTEYAAAAGLLGAV